jgi:hypothetical protein
MKAKLQLNAGILRIILSVSLFVIIAGAVAGFVFAHQRLTEYAVDISKKKVDAKASETTIQSLEMIEKQLEDNSKVRQTADSLRLDESHPEFNVSEELKGIAADNNIEITLTTTASATSDGTSSGTTTTPATPQVAPTAPSDTFSITMDVKPEGSESFNETTYKDFLQFLRDLEQNLPKIKINGVKVSNGSAGDSDSSGSTETQGADEGILVGSISLEIYIKK